MYRTLVLNFQNTRSGATLPVRFTIDPHPLAQRWASRLSRLLKLKFSLEKSYLLHGWQGRGRDLRTLCREVNHHIAKINRHYASGDLKYHISDIFDPQTIGQDEFNRLHFHFETLIGQVWNPSPYYAIAGYEIAESIRQLNNLCHEMETFVEGRKYHERKMAFAIIHASFIPKRGGQILREDLAAEDYSQFAMNRRFGDVFLHYAQLGKTHWEAFNDRDEHVAHGNISGLRYLTGEFDIGLMEDTVRSEEECRAFSDWLRTQGFNPEDKTLALGYARVAQIDRSQFKAATNFEILQELFGYDDISKIEVTRDSMFPFRRKTSRTYQSASFVVAEDNSSRSEAFFGSTLNNHPSP